MNWSEKLVQEKARKIQDTQRIAHLEKMVKLQEKHGGRECLCDKNDMCDYHFYTKV